MQVLEAKVADQHYAADFGRVEALVTLLIKQHNGQPPRDIHVRTSQPKDGAQPLNKRLIDDAIRLALTMAPTTRTLDFRRAA